MNFLRRGSASASDEPVDDTTDDEGRETVVVGDTRAQTVGKGRPTPSRRDAQGKRRGPVAPAPKTQREAMKRAKALRGTKEDRKAKADDRRKRMMAGDDSVLLPRDRGPARAYARDLVDARRNLMGLFMPLAIVIFVTVIVPVPQVQTFGSLVCLVMLVMMALEGVMLGRYVVTRVRTKFPNEQVGGLSFGWYAFTRATQLRRLRMPKPRVARGTKID
ncbi:hypothetical protein Acsp06_36110 [Actinomycetospora sp. NBRC 106375]|uniref:DUF3043 domain-containing protein n=1 Tax=Actinomycetospora sp. NBRC 106375 TaxID=3032207 RepID=UPI0024A4DF83|nr:DUF3043 domain-containing protein [Actinomycetospora sp. NBRC 106375]GLZ47426.1 hypothetical protein Acsp06_36110 [Actinomycetospora sp. NBRC 106375]